MNLAEMLTAELQQEAVLTKRMLERLPEASFDWKPSEKSRTLREIASHIANIFGLFLAPLRLQEYNRQEYKALGNTKAEILATFERNIADALETLKHLSNEQLFANWQYLNGTQTIFAMPRYAVIRAMGINHLVHHRGQLSVYLRLLNVPLPPVYGPTADEAV